MLMFYPESCFDVITVKYMQRDVRELPLPLLLLDGEICTSALAFATEGGLRHRSFKTQAKYMRHIGILYDYYVYGLKSPPLTDTEETKRILDKFYDALLIGTVDKSGNDPTLLGWLPRRKREVNLIIDSVEEYVNYCVAELSMIPVVNNEKQFVGAVKASHEFEKQYRHSAYSFWSHLNNNADHLASRKFKWSSSSAIRADRSRQIKAGVGLRAPKKFPIDLAFKLILKGTIKRGVDISDESIPYHKRFNVRDQLVIMLILFGGERVSQVCNMFSHDVLPYDNNSILISRIVHPEDGLVDTINNAIVSRGSYLWKKFGLLPRTRLAGKKHSGFKGLALNESDNSSFTLFICGELGHKLMIKALSEYKKYVRPELMKKSKVKHPYLFLNSTGAPLKTDNVRDIWTRCCKKIGLEGIRALGQNPHGGRHAYGYYIRNVLKLSPEIVQLALKHCSPESQLIYTMTDMMKAQQEIDTAYENIRTGNTSPENLARADIFIPKDPKHIFSGYLFDSDLD